MTEKHLPLRWLVTSGSDIYERSELPSGSCELTCPAAMSREDLDDMEAWLHLLIAKLRRRIVAESVQSAALAPTPEEP